MQGFREKPLVCRECRPFWYMNSYQSLRAHLRARHGVKLLSPDDFLVYETYPGSSVGMRFTMPNNRRHRLAMGTDSVNNLRENQDPPVSTAEFVPVAESNVPVVSTNSEDHAQPTVEGPVVNNLSANPSSFSQQALEEVVNQLVERRFTVEMAHRLPQLGTSIDRKIESALRAKVPSIVSDTIFEAVSRYSGESTNSSLLPCATMSRRERLRQVCSLANIPPPSHIIPLPYVISDVQVSPTIAVEVSHIESDGDQLDSDDEPLSIATSLPVCI